MATLLTDAAPPTDTAASPEAPPPARPVVLPPDMEGWLMTEQAADRLGLTPRKFRDYAAQHALPKRKIDIRVYYAPEVIEAAVQGQAARRESAAKNRGAKSQGVLPPTARAAETAGLDARALPPVDRPDLLRQALTAAQAQTALLDRIVQSIGRIA